MKTDTLELGILHREFRLEAGSINEAKRTVSVLFSTPDPALRWYGWEVLSHDEGACDLSRLNDGGAFLSGHDPDKQIGVVSKASISADRRGRATVRFGNSALAQQEFADVKESIRSKISVGYLALEMREEGEKDGQPVFIVTRWQPIEISLVAVGLDPNCAVGRANDSYKPQPTIVTRNMNAPSQPNEPNSNSQREAIRREEAQRQTERIREIYAIAERCPACPKSEVERFVSEGRSSDSFRRLCFAEYFGDRASGGAHPIVTPGGRDPFGNGGGEARTIGAMIVRAPEFAQIQRGGRKNVSMEFPHVSNFRAVTTGDIGATIEHTGQVVFSNQRLTIADLLAPGATQSGTVRYPRESSFTPAATTVAEGGAKPEQAFDLTPIDAQAKKIAAWCKISDELLADSPAAQAYIESRLGFAVLREEEEQLLNGGGTGSDILGLLQTAGIQTQARAADTHTDAIRKAIGKIDSNTDFVASGIAIHPTDWQTVELQKDAEGRYIVGIVATVNEMGQPVKVPGLWGLPVAVSKSIAQGTACVGAYRTAAQLFRRMGLLIEMTNSNEDDFKKNLVMIRAEIRAALAIYAPSAFCQVTGL